MYKMCITRTDNYQQLRNLIEKNYKSKELWELFEQSCTPIQEEVFYPEEYTVNFITLVRTATDNRVLTSAGERLCMFRSEVLLADASTSLYDAVVLNAHAVYCNVLVVDNPGKRSMYANSFLQPMGVVYFKGQFFVYSNVLVSDEVFDLVTIGDAHLREGLSITSIRDFCALPDTVDELLADSLVVVKGDTNDA